MPDRFPGYDVLSKRDGVSWNEKTREVVDRRLGLSPEPAFLSAEAFACLEALADCLVPGLPGHAKIPAARLVDDQLARNQGDGYRREGEPTLREAWRWGLEGLTEAALSTYGARFEALSEPSRLQLIKKMERGELKGDAWKRMRSDLFFKNRAARDLIHAYYAHPAAWSEIGFGGPASPRGYVRMGYDERDPWDAAEAREGEAGEALRINRRVR